MVAMVYSEEEKKRLEGGKKKHQEGTFSLQPSVLVSIAPGISSNRSGVSALVPMSSNYQPPLACMPM